jgi:hypothetical protein
MSDYRDANDSFYGYEPAERRTSTGWAGWGWIAGAMFLVIVLAVAFGVGHQPTRVASNDTTQSAPTRMAPPAGTMNPAAPSVVPGLTPPPATTPAPNK